MGVGHVFPDVFGSLYMADMVAREGSLQDSITEAARLMGYDTLKEEQRWCLSGFILGHDIFAVLPTGFGKTVCYTCLPKAFDIYHKRKNQNKAIVIIISPLSALICDQVCDLQRRGVYAGYITAESTPEIKNNVSKSLYSIVFMSPEQLVQK